MLDEVAKAGLGPSINGSNNGGNSTRQVQVNPRDGSIMITEDNNFGDGVHSSGESWSQSFQQSWPPQPSPSLQDFQHQAGMDKLRHVTPYADSGDLSEEQLNA